MDCVEICGGKPLSGRVEIQGSKNAVLPILAGCAASSGISRIEHCPRIRDVFDTIELLELLGCSVCWEGTSLVVDSNQLSGWKIQEQLAERMRSSVLFLGALLGRIGKAELPYPGGCTLGQRPIDLHLQAMKAMGAKIKEEEDWICAESGALFGKDICLRFPSVGATENIILAAVNAQGVTRIKNPAREPEIEDLCKFFQEKGADISRCTDGALLIRGGKKLRDSVHRLIPDRIVAGTYLMAAAVTEGQITIDRMPAEQMESVLAVLRQMGIRIWKEQESYIVDGRKKRVSTAFLETAPYPGFPTDLQSPLMTLLAVTEGESCIRETIFESRFKSAEQLQAMGAEICIRGNEARIHGIPRLQGTWVKAEELRGAAALFLAGLNASGCTRITGCRFADRGYENISEQFRQLGAEIRIIEKDDGSRKDSRRKRSTGENV